MAEYGGQVDAEGAAIEQGHADRLRRQRIRIDDSVGSDEQALGQFVALRVIERLAAEVGQCQAAAQQVGGGQVAQAEPGIVDIHIGSDRSADQAQDQRRGGEIDPRDLVGRKTFTGNQAGQAVDRTMGGAAGWKGLVTDFGDAPDATQLGENFLHLRQPGRKRRIKQVEIAERPFEDITRTAEAGARQVDGSHCGPCCQPDLQSQAYLIGKILKPEPRADVVEWLQENKITPTSMIDVSDGLSSELLHICRSSDVGCLIYEEKIPMHDDARAMAMQFQVGAVACALNGGEDYELLFTIRQEDYEQVARSADISVIGYITEKAEGANLLTTGGTKHKLTAQGWTAF